MLEHSLLGRVLENFSLVFPSAVDAHATGSCSRR